MDGKTDDTPTIENFATFQTIKALKNQSIIPSLTIMVGSTSRLIEGKSGKYQIGGLVDVDGNKMNINLYDANINKIEFGNIYNIKNLKLIALNKDGNIENRLVTTKITKISDASEDEKRKFDTVSLGQNQIHGTVLGLSDINSYNSCDKHWNKLNEEDICPRCDAKPSLIKIDFTADLYIQDDDSEEMRSFRIFKRQIKMLIPQLDEQSPGEQLSDLEDKGCIVEYDDPNDEDAPIIPKRLILKEMRGSSQE